MRGNKREYTRFNALTSPFNCVISAPDRPIVYVNNVSCEGLGIFTYKELKENDEIDLEITFPQDDIPLYVKGKVNWVSEESSKEKVYNAGIKLVSMNENDRKRFINYIHISFSS